MVNVLAIEFVKFTSSLEYNALLIDPGNGEELKTTFGS